MRSRVVALATLVFLFLFVQTDLYGLNLLAFKEIPRLPHIFIDTQQARSHGDTITVLAGGDLQAALDRAHPNDVIALEAGAVFTGNFTLPKKSGRGWITIRTSSDAELPTEGTRITPQFAGVMAKLVSPNADAALRTEAGAHHYRIIGIEFSVAEEVKLNYGIVRLGEGNESDAALLPRDIIIDRCYIHGHAGSDIARGIALNSAHTAVIESYISECHGVGFDTQAIAGWNGPGPFKIVNNYLEGAGENVMFGGADPRIADLVPSDIEFRRNHCFKPLSWKEDDPGYAGRHWSVKNLFELKNARRVLIDGNIFENNWVDGQNGTAILFTVRNQEGTAPWSTVEDVTFTNNIVRHSAAAINILGRDYNHPSQQTKRLLIKNNLFEDIDGAKWGGGNGVFLTITESLDVTVEHNTVLHTGNIITAYGVANEAFRFTNNLAAHNEYGVIGDSTVTGLATLNRYFPDLKFKKNVIAGARVSNYPAKKNFYPASLDDVGFVDKANSNYRLSETSPYKNAGTDDKDIGADIDEIERASTAQGD